MQTLAEHSFLLRYYQKRFVGFLNGFVKAKDLWKGSTSIQKIKICLQTSSEEEIFPAIFSIVELHSTGLRWRKNKKTAALYQCIMEYGLASTDAMHWKMLCEVLKKQFSEVKPIWRGLLCFVEENPITKLYDALREQEESQVKDLLQDDRNWEVLLEWLQIWMREPLFPIPAWWLARVSEWLLEIASRGIDIQRVFLVASETGNIDILNPLLMYCDTLFFTQKVNLKDNCYSIKVERFFSLLQYAYFLQRKEIHQDEVRLIDQGLLLACAHNQTIHSFLKFKKDLFPIENYLFLYFYSCVTGNIKMVNRLHKSHGGALETLHCNMKIVEQDLRVSYSTYYSRTVYSYTPLEVGFLLACKYNQKGIIKRLLQELLLQNRMSRGDIHFCAVSISLLLCSSLKKARASISYILDHKMFRIYPTWKLVYYLVILLPMDTKFWYKELMPFLIMEDREEQQLFIRHGTFRGKKCPLSDVVDSNISMTFSEIHAVLRGNLHAADNLSFNDFIGLLLYRWQGGRALRQYASRMSTAFILSIVFYFEDKEILPLLYALKHHSDFTEAHVLSYIRAAYILARPRSLLSLLYVMKKSSTSQAMGYLRDYPYTGTKDEVPLIVCLFSYAIQSYEFDWLIPLIAKVENAYSLFLQIASESNDENMQIKSYFFLWKYQEKFLRAPQVEGESKELLHCLDLVISSPKGTMLQCSELLTQHLFPLLFADCSYAEKYKKCLTLAIMQGEVKVLACLLEQKCSAVISTAYYHSCMHFAQKYQEKETALAMMHLLAEKQKKHKHNFCLFFLSLQKDKASTASVLIDDVAVAISSFI